MSKRIVNTATNATRVVNTSPRAKTLDGATVGKAMGAQATGSKRTQKTDSKRAKALAAGLD